MVAGVGATTPYPASVFEKRLRRPALSHQPLQPTGLVEPEQIDEEVETFQVWQEPGEKQVLRLPVPAKSLS